MVSLMKLLTPRVSVLVQVERHKSIFSKYPAEKLWNSAAPMAKRTGRGKRAKAVKREDLGRKQQLGEGVAGMMWPGLNESVHNKQYRRTEEEQDEFLKKMEEREKLRILPPREKVMGWTGAKWGGVHLSPIAPLDGISFEDFNSVIMNVARVSHMTGAFGRVYSVKAIVAVGNGNGVFGMSAATSSDISSAVRKARLKAVKRLTFIERFEDRTVFDDLYVNYHHTWMYIRQQPPGYGIRAHRAVTDMCKLIGISDLYVKTYGAMTLLNLTKCFIKGLQMQETHQSKADRTGYHVVRYDEQRNGYPQVLASPSSAKTKEEEFDEMGSYINQDMLLREFRNIEGLRDKKWSRAQVTNNRGEPVPPCQELPEHITDIRNYRL